MLKHLSCQDAITFVADKTTRWLDIRAASDFHNQHIPGALHLPSEALLSFIEDTDKATPVIVYCYHGVSSVRVGHHLVTAGFLNVSTLDGGFSEWCLTPTATFTD